MKLAVLLALVACSRSERVPTAPHRASPIPAAAAELVVGIVDDWNATNVTLRRYRRGDGWRPIGAPWPGVVGRTGVAWGAGLHGTGAPPDRPGPVKREGDGKSPAGVFALAGSYGYAAAPPAGAKLPYTALTASHRCVDDPRSREYARIVDERAVTVDWKSHEVMRRDDVLYTWVVDVAHNTARTPGGGSCIFLHVWGGAGTTTAGCTAMAEDRLAELVASLDPSAVFVLLPRAEYDALATAWQLPR